MKTGQMHERADSMELNEYSYIHVVLKFKPVLLYFVLEILLSMQI